MVFTFSFANNSIVSILSTFTLFFGPRQESSPLFHANPMSKKARNLYCRRPVQSYLLMTEELGNQNSADLQCMTGNFVPLGTMGKLVVGHCMLGTYAHAYVGGNLQVFRPLDTQALSKGYSACPCALPAHWAV